MLRVGRRDGRAAVKAGINYKLSGEISRRHRGLTGSVVE